MGDTELPRPTPMRVAERFLGQPPTPRADDAAGEAPAECHDADAFSFARHAAAARRRAEVKATPPRRRRARRFPCSKFISRRAQAR